MLLRSSAAASGVDPTSAGSEENQPPRMTTWARRVGLPHKARTHVTVGLLFLLFLALIPTFWLSSRAQNTGLAKSSDAIRSSCPSASPCLDCRRFVHPEAIEQPYPLYPLHSYFGTTETEKRCDESHSFTLIRRFRENNTTYCEPSEHRNGREAAYGHMRCLEAEGCVICRGGNLMVDFSKIVRLEEAGTHKHLHYKKGAFGMNCDFNRKVVANRDYAHLLSSMWRTWVDHAYQQCDIIVEHPVIFAVRYEAWNLWHQLGDWFCAFVSSLVLGIDPQLANAQVIFFDEHDLSALSEPWSLFSPEHKVKRALADTDWAGKKVCFRDAIFPYEGYGAAFQRNGYMVSIGDPCGPSDLLMSFARWMLNQYSLLQSKRVDTLAISLIVRRSGTGERNVDSRMSNEDEVIEAIRERISKLGSVRFDVVDLAVLSFREQLELIHTKTNILIGAHGAGLSHLMFLPTEAVVVELVPPSHRGMTFFRNMAKQTSKVYLTVPMQREDKVPIDRFLATLDAAVTISRSFGTNIAAFDLQD